MSQSQNDDHFLTGATGDEQMSKRWPVNDEQMRNWVGVEHLRKAVDGRHPAPPGMESINLSR